jgi:hypothetical protein
MCYIFSASFVRDTFSSDKHLGAPNANKRLLVFNIKLQLQLCQANEKRGLRRRSAARRLLGLRVGIPPGAWISLCSE